MKYNNTFIRFFLKMQMPVFFLLLTSGTASAQQMDGHHEHEPLKNIYLRMMDTMMVAMEAAPQHVTAATVFMQQMIPHHQGAVSMARYEIEHGNDFAMIQLAKSILAEQTVELKQMQLKARKYRRNYM
jgi:uncharacterized protein (DUF305 family)